MDGNNRVICSRALAETDKANLKLGSLDIHRDLDSGNLQDNLIAATRKYIHMPKRRGRPRKRKLEVKSQPPTKKTFVDTMMDYALGLRRDRFRPIRPKPVSSAAPVSKNRLLEMSSTLNIPTLMSNRFIFTTPLLDRNKTQHISTLDNFEGENNCVKLDDDDEHTESVALAIEERNVYENATDRNSNTITINNSLRNARSTPNPQKGSIELFFESMAQTVLNLPMEVQADIKMQICKIVTNAEVKYCGSQTKFND